jgi:hypothetical protein
MAQVFPRWAGRCALFAASLESSALTSSDNISLTQATFDIFDAAFLDFSSLHFGAPHE